MLTTSLRKIYLFLVLSLLLTISASSSRNLRGIEHIEKHEMVRNIIFIDL